MGARIAIWVVETEVGGGLPTERIYAGSGPGEPIGHVILPETMAATTYDAQVRLEEASDVRPNYRASVSYRQLVSVALRGDFGLSWELVA